MRNKLLIICYTFFFNSMLIAENVKIESKNITIDKNKQTTIFKDEVIVKTYDNNIIQSDYAEYNRNTGFIKLMNNIKAIDAKKNIIETKNAEYSEKTKIFKSYGFTKIITSENYIIEGTNIVFNNQRKSITSDNKATIVDQEGNKVSMENFSYQTDNNIFKSIGLIKIKDKTGNDYEFSQIYIDTIKKEILGTDAKAFIDSGQVGFNKDNKPRIFSNSLKISNSKSTFSKGIFTTCNYRENDKCPPWSIQATNILHDNKKKTVYYDNAVVKIYDVPIFYFPKLSHPDPSVTRRSGVLPPSLFTSTNLSNGISIPYFFDISKDKNFTLTNRFYATENPLFTGEYNQAFKNSNFLVDFGYTEGYKKASTTKKSGDKSHFFSKFVSNFTSDTSESVLSLSLQNVSDDKYLKLYKIKSNLVDFSKNTLENKLDFTHENENIFFGLNASIYETLNDAYNDKYEYILPEITIDKNLTSSEKFGNIDIQSNYKTHNYDTNKLTNFFVNDLNWNSQNFFFKSMFKNKFIGNIKNINYDTKNVSPFKDDFTSELYGSLGFLTELSFKKNRKTSIHSITPKSFFRFAPGSMRKEDSGPRLDFSNAFSINRLDNLNNFETGLSGTLGFEYEIENENNNNFNFSVAQIINEKENKKMHSKTSLNQKLSDLVGSATLEIDDTFSLNYNFALDQNYKDLNYNEFGTTANFGSLNVDLNYLQEKKHIGNQNYFKGKINLKNDDKGLLSFETKRNLITNSSEFYNLSYEYINDCLRAGLVYRREFYNDSELEPENSLMFKITLTPFGNLSSPSFNQ